MDGDAAHPGPAEGTAAGVARHGVAAPRGQRALPGSRGGRFGRMFPSLPASDPGREALDELAAAMKQLSAAEGPENRRIPSGYTYLGQLIDHDITFDPTSRFQRDNDPGALVNFRTPRLDLDSLYGSGPVDQPFLYDWSARSHGVKLLVGGSPRGGRLAKCDLPRNEQGRALIGDARNDENLIVSQLHLLLLRFHNKVIDLVRKRRGRFAAADVFEETQRIVRWHYQWIVTHDYLPKVAGDTMAASVLPRREVHPGITIAASRRRLYDWQDEPVIPVEFSGAAFRFAHSMVRRDYVLNDIARVVPIFPDDATASGDEHLGGFRRLRSSLEITWEHFFDISETEPNLSQGLDEILSEPLFRLPLAFALGGVPEPPASAPRDERPKTTELARLNLHRGRALGLPAGADVAQAMGQEPLSPDELFPPEHFTLSSDGREALLRATPLWFYLLREASCRGSQGRWLGPIGGRIVAEVLVGLLEGDPQSYLRQAPDWRPELPGTDGDFTMADLVTFTNGA